MSIDQGTRTKKICQDSWSANWSSSQLSLSQRERLSILFRYCSEKKPRFSYRKTLHISHFSIQCDHQISSLHSSRVGGEVSKEWKKWGRNSVTSKCTVSIFQWKLFKVLAVGNLCRRAVSQTELGESSSKLGRQGERRLREKQKRSRSAHLEGHSRHNGLSETFGIHLRRQWERSFERNWPTVCSSSHDKNSVALFTILLQDLLHSSRVYSFDHQLIPTMPRPTQKEAAWL